MKWEEVTLDKLGSVSRGKSKHRPRNDKILFGGQYPFIQTADVKAAELYLTEYTETYNERGLAQSKLWPVGTLCITIAANIAETAILGIEACFPDSIMGFIPFEETNVKFVKYAFDILQKNCKNISQGAAQDNLSWERLSTIKFPKPSLATQNKIVEILSAYDDLIANNQKQIKLLEEAAQRLYKEWFVDLRFPGHEQVKIVDGVPEGWTFCRLDDITTINGKSISTDYPYDYINYVDLSSVNRGVIKEYTPYGLVDAPGRAKRIANDGDVIWGMVRPNLRSYALVMKPLETDIFSTGFAVITPKQNIPFTYIYHLVTQDSFVGYLVNCTNGAAYPAVKPCHFENAEILFPNKDLLAKFHYITEPMYRRIYDINKQNRLLSEARDRLLPKLMSGEIEV